MSLQEQPSVPATAEQRELDEFQTRVRTRIANIWSNKDGNE